MMLRYMQHDCNYFIYSIGGTKSLCATLKEQVEKDQVKL